MFNNVKCFCVSFSLFCFAFAAVIIENVYCVNASVIAKGPVTDTEGRQCGSLYWSLDSEGNFVVTGEGPGAAYRPEGRDEYDRYCPWDNYRHLIKKVWFNCKFTGTSLYHYNYGASINSWFINCVNLEEVSDIPSGITDMCAAFAGCSSLRKCGRVPDTVITMQFTFSDCSSLIEPPNLSSGLRDDCCQKYGDKDLLIQSSALGLTFSGCTSLITTPDFSVCRQNTSLIGTFADCISLRTICELPENFVYFFNTFTNCVSVRGVFCSYAKHVEISGMPFYNFSQNNDYILFVRQADPELYNYMLIQAGEGFRGYLWGDNLTIYFETNIDVLIPSWNVIMEYGALVNNSLDYRKTMEVGEQPYSEVRISDTVLQDIYRDGYFLAGWYWDPEFTKEVFIDDLVNPPTNCLLQKRVTIYAKWFETEGPRIYYDYMDYNWKNHPVTVEFRISKKGDSQLGSIYLYKVENESENNSLILYDSIDLSENDTYYYEYSYTIGDKETKLFEGVTEWMLVASDLGGNISELQFTIRLDYTPPDIYTDCLYDYLTEIIYDEESKVNVSCKDNLSGVGVLRINPSCYQNEFINDITTPYVINEPFIIQYEYPRDKKIQGYILSAYDCAGNYASRIIITRYIWLSHIKRIVPRANYD